MSDFSRKRSDSGRKRSENVEFWSEKVGFQVGKSLKRSEKSSGGDLIRQIMNQGNPLDFLVELGIYAKDFNFWV